jgi:GNAT superfamily N-acetyltransferase
MYETRWADRSEIPLLADFWHKMQCEMVEKDGIPKQSKERIKEIQKLFLKEHDLQNLRFRVAIDNKGTIISCAGGLLRLEYSSPLSEEQSLFGWVISVYTLPHYRKNGLAAKLVEEIYIWLKEKGAGRARLWASIEGRRVYEKIGFRSMMDMEKTLS